MSLEDAFESSAVHERRAKPSYPDGWTPGLQLDSEGGEIVSDGSATVPDFDALLAEWAPPGVNVDEYEIIEDSIGFKAWDGWVGKGEPGRQFSFRARVRRKCKTVDMSHWRKYIRSHKPPSFSKADAKTSLVIAPADWQIGKPDGDGWRGTVDRWLEAIGKTQDRLRETKPETLYVLPLGDLVEGCSGHYAQQTFRSELNQTQQQEVVVDMAVRGLRDLAKYAPKIVVAPVGGNHGEVRQGGRSYTDFADNYDVSLFRHVRRVFAENAEAYGHISFAIPQADLTQTLDVSGLLVGIAHGHQFRRGTNAVDAAEKWWRGQMAGQQPIGDADLLLSGHRHHLVVSRQGSRTFMQAPALDGGSTWFTDISGLDSPPGTLSFLVRDGEWDQLRVL